MFGGEVVRDGAREDGGGIGDFGGQIGVDEQRRDGEIRRKRCGFGELIAPVAAEPPAETRGRDGRARTPGPDAMPHEILERRQLEPHGGRCERRPAEMPRQQRDRADLDDESAKADQR